jgi:hypothetical protein
MGGAKPNRSLDQDARGQPAATAERITVTLVPKASADLQRTQDRTRLSKTDVVNRAVSLYEWADAAQSDGAEIILRTAAGEEHIVRFL